MTGPSDSTAASSLTPAQVAEKRANILAMRDKTLEQLFAQKPEARDELNKAVGYAVFDSSQMNIVMLVTAHGTGVMVDNATKKPTYMVAARAGTGPGLGYKDFRQVLIFKNRQVFDQFLKVGADLTASADATVKLKPGGASAGMNESFNPYIATYSFTDSGVLLQANWGGGGYLPDSQLNQP
jgi:lipid-binding SYLF domain-containing protein